MGAGSSAPQSTRTESGVEVAVKDRYHAYLPKNIDRHVVLTEEKVKLVHDHWNFIADEVCVFFVSAGRVVQIRLSFLRLVFDLFPRAHAQDGRLLADDWQLEIAFIRGREEGEPGGKSVSPVSSSASLSP